MFVAKSTIQEEIIADFIYWLQISLRSYSISQEICTRFFLLLCFVVVIHWLIFPYPPGLLHWHCGNLTIAPVPAKQPWWIRINTSWEFIMNDCITTTKQSTTKPCAYFLGYTVQPTDLPSDKNSKVSEMPQYFVSLECLDFYIKGTVYHWKMLTKELWKFPETHWHFRNWKLSIDALAQTRNSQVSLWKKCKLAVGHGVKTFMESVEKVDNNKMGLCWFNCI